MSYILTIIFFMVGVIMLRAKSTDSQEAIDQQIKITNINKPSKEESKQKIKELSEFLSKVWDLPKNSE